MSDWALKQDGETLVVCWTELQCVAEAFERGLILTSRGRRFMAEGVTIEPADMSAAFKEWAKRKLAEHGPDSQEANR